jgi:hypothetical protein
VLRAVTVQTGLDLLEQGGLTQLSMRKIATALDTGRSAGPPSRGRPAAELLLDRACWMQASGPNAALGIS